MNYEKNGILKYPCVFVHGMFGWGSNEGINRLIPYWGATTGSLKDHLYSQGIEAYEASVGPVSSAWDQACELYAQLTGTKVDYGAAHSKKAGHYRFGRKYFAPLFPGWSKEKKIHLIAHSFGGLCVRMLTHLLTYGAPEEVEATGEETSPLFKGGMSELVESVTTLCTPLNGTSAYDMVTFLKLLKPAKKVVFSYAGIMGRSSLNAKFVDFHLEQFGLTDKPGEHGADKLRQSLELLYNSEDCVEHDLSRHGAKSLNKRVKISPDIYYFSYAFNCIKAVGRKRIHVPICKLPLLTWTSSMMILESKHAAKKGKKVEYSNDGLVNVRAALYPYDEPHENFTGGKKLSKGVWNVMPLEKGDHGTAIGLLAPKLQTHAFYARHIAMLRRIEQE